MPVPKRKFDQFFRKTSAYRAKSYKPRRLALIKKLGGLCVVCSLRHHLELDHINGRNYDIKKLNRWTRIARYEKEAAESKLQILCRWCNASKQDRKMNDFLKSLEVCP